MSKVMDIYVKFTKTTHQIWSCHVTLASNSENFYFLPNSVLNFRKSYQIWGNRLKNKKVTGKKQIGGWKIPPSPSAFRVKRFHTSGLMRWWGAYINGACIWNNTGVKDMVAYTRGNR